MIFPPAVITGADELLGDAQRMLDTETEALYANPDVHVSCGPNCNRCCEHAIILTAAEVRAIRTAVAELPASTQVRIAARVGKVRDRLRDGGLAAAAETSTFSNDFAKQYFALGEPCPLLIDGACSVRAIRPLTCREYLVASDPAYCANPASEHFVVIKRRRPVNRNFVRVSAAFDEQRRHLLPLALDEPPPQPEPSPRSGPKMARVLLGG